MELKRAASENTGQDTRGGWAGGGGGGGVTGAGPR